MFIKTLVTAVIVKGDELNLCQLHQTLLKKDEKRKQSKDKFYSYKFDKNSESAEDRSVHSLGTGKVWVSVLLGPIEEDERKSTINKAFRRFPN